MKDFDRINRSCFNPGAGIAPGGPFVPIIGGTMTGPLILSGDPIAALGAATKQTVDAADAAAAAAQTTANNALPKAGGIMSGAINQPIAPVAPTDLTNKQYVDNTIAADAPGGPFTQVPGVAVVQGYVTMAIPGLGTVKVLYTT